MRFLLTGLLALLFAAPSFAQTVNVAPTYRDCSIASLSGSSQQILTTTNYQRKSLAICDFGSNTVGVNLSGGTASIGGAGTISLPTTGGVAAQCLFMGPGGTLPV